MQNPPPSKVRSQKPPLKVPLRHPLRYPYRFLVSEVTSDSPRDSFGSKEACHPLSFMVRRLATKPRVSCSEAGEVTISPQRVASQCAYGCFQPKNRGGIWPPKWMVYNDEKLALFFLMDDLGVKTPLFLRNIHMLRVNTLVTLTLVLATLPGDPYGQQHWCSHQDVASERVPWKMGPESRSL